MNIGLTRTRVSVRYSLLEMTSWTALTWHIGIKTAFYTKNIKSKYFGIFIMKILNSKRNGGKCILKEVQHITTSNS